MVDADMDMVEEAEAVGEAVVSEGVEEAMVVEMCNKNQVDTMTTVDLTHFLDKGVVSFISSDFVHKIRCMQITVHVCLIHILETHTMQMTFYKFLNFQIYVLIRNFLS